jgi:hypothetical protein
MVKFLLFSDFHYGKDHYIRTLDDLDKILKRGADEGVDFVMQCGDFCIDPSHSPELYRAFLDNKYGLPVYGVVGNHDLEIADGNTVELIAGLQSNREIVKPYPEATYWYADVNNIRLVGLDTNYSQKRDTLEWEHTRPGTASCNMKNDHLAEATPEQMEWLDGVLADAQAKGQKVVIFSHHPFSGCFIFPHTNSDEMQALLAKYKKTGVLCINGDLHAEFYAGIKGVIYYGMTSSTFFNFGLDDNGRPTRVYPDDVTYEYIEFDAEGNEIGRRERRVNELANDHIYYCAEPLSAIVTITDTGALFIEGMNAGWLAGLAPRNDRKTLGFPHDPYITDKYFQLDW